MLDVKLTAKGVARLRAGHPWIYRLDVAQAGPEAGGADTARVLDEKGRPVASATWAPGPSPIALRIYARGETFVPLDDALLAERLERALARRRRVSPTAPPAERVVHAEADELPGLFVDRYGDAAVVQTATAAMDRRVATVGTLLARRLGLRLVVRRDDGSLRDHEALPRVKEFLHGSGPTLVGMREGESLFELDLLEDHKTGGYLDQQGNHVRAGELARGQAVDAFTYHGGFALALARGAEQVVGVDRDPQAIARARRNAELSGRRNVTFEAADAFAALRTWESQGRRFDTVVVDPPALAKRQELSAALRDYRELNLRAMRITAKDGVLVTCSCSGKVTYERFDAMLREAAAAARREIVVFERRGAGADHPVLLGVPETEYLKCWFLLVL